MVGSENMVLCVALEVGPSHRCSWAAHNGLVLPMLLYNNERQQGPVWSAHGLMLGSRDGLNTDGRQDPSKADWRWPSPVPCG